ncbi:swr complex subunit [Arachnomyces sp. PD_36]|nr:swr complex subunit [Arachnomyces sp. PD_36]
MAPSRAESKPLAEANTLDPEQDEEYDSEEDSDFDIDAAPAEGAAEEASSDSEPDVDTAEAGEGVDGEASLRAKKRRKLSAEGPADRGGVDDEDVVIGDLDSGDEATIRRGKERKKGKANRGKDKKSKKGSGRRQREDDDEDDDQDEDFDDDDEGGGEGGFVRTRGMRMKLQEERKPLAKADQSTVDVDALWARLNAPATDTTASTENNPVTKGSNRDNDNDTVMADGEGNNSKPDTARPGEETITIRRKYKFAGDIITEEKVVPKDSAEAKLYLSLNKNTSTENENETSEQHPEDGKPEKIHLRRPLRRISRFDPNPPGAIKRSWEKQATAILNGSASPDAGEESSAAAKGPKLNTVEKSKLDWAAYVDRAGIKDDLNVHSKAKEGYLGRMEFLNRLEDKREEERRNARLKNMG